MIRRALVLLAFSLPAMAIPPCDTPEPKDVACIIRHTRNPESEDRITYLWREAGLPADVYCGVRDTQPAFRAGFHAKPAEVSWNPYQWDGRCFPAASETRVYRVKACWKETGVCSVNWSDPITVIGVPPSEIRCCSSTSCGGC